MSSSGRNGPLATIVIPTKDRPRLLERAVRSALAQTVEDIQVVVVDDGSAEPVRLGLQDPRLLVVRNPRALGASAARNAGLRTAEGRWVTFTDDDDELLPGMIQTSLEAAERSALPGPVAVLSAHEVVDGDSRLLETRLPTTVARQAPPYPEAPDDGFVQDANTLFAPAEVLRAMGGWDEAIRGWEMDDLLIRLVQRCSVQGVPEVTYRRFRHRGARKSGHAPDMVDGARLVLSKHREFYEAHRRLYGRQLAIVGATDIRRGRWWPAVWAMTRSLRADPARPKAIAQWVGTLTGPRLYGSYLEARQRRTHRGPA